MLKCALWILFISVYFCDPAFVPRIFDRLLACFTWLCLLDSDIASDLHDEYYIFSVLTMAHCINCSSAIDINEQSYLGSDMGPDIISIIEQEIGHEVGVDDAICSQCFNIFMQALPAERPIEEYELEHRHDTTVCVWCRNSLFQRRVSPLPEGPERQYIANMIAPRQIPEGGLVCYSCYMYTRNILQHQGNSATHLMNLNVCVWCHRSLNNTRRHTIPEGPERDEILARIHPRQIPPGGLVCYACWVSARRNVQRAENIAQRRDINSVCACCMMSVHHRQTRILRSLPIREVIAARIYPRELPENATLCINCWAQAQETNTVEQGELIHQPEQQPRPIITLDDFVHTTQTSSSCFVPGCNNVERKRVPEYLRILIFKSQKVFVTNNSRVCNAHKSIYNWEFLDQSQFSNSFTKDEIESMLNLTLQNIDNHSIDFSDINNMDDAYVKFWIGVTKDNFNNIYRQIHPELTCKNPETALGVYLLKARTGESHERIASLLQMSKSSITRLLQIARQALINLFVPMHLGINNISRENLINRNLVIPEGLFGNREARVPIVICDGTYIYLQKSSNYLFQKETYSLHKYRNLVKPFLIVATDGYIVDVLGPYPATESDAEIMKALFQNENEGLRTLFQPNDVFILDRGFRDAIPMLEELGFIIKKPESREQGEIQLPTIKANNTRCVTLCRWVVEVVNGRLKRDFKLLRQEYFNLAATHLMDDIRICAAIINAFHPVIENRPDANTILMRAMQRKDMPNRLAELILTNRINRYRAQFTRIDGQLPALHVFPEMTMSDLILFSLGTYQIKQARSYFGEHLRQHGSFQVEMSDQLEVIAQATLSQSDLLLIRGRIKSRHSSGRIYYTYILLAQEGSGWDEKLASYYCSCIAGQRTMGCCAHIMTIVWYLGWARYQENVEAPASFLDGILVRDDLENHK